MVDHADDLDEVDVAVTAYLDDGEWVVDELDLDEVDDVEAVVSVLRTLRVEADGDVLCLLSVEEEYCVIVRLGDGGPRVLLSDVMAAVDFDLASSVLDLLDLEDPDEEDDAEPVGDLDLLDDLGVGEAVLAELLDDPDAYPDEVLSDVARLLGFGELFDEVAGLASA